MQDRDGGMSEYENNKAGAKYGTGYCDAQCPQDIKFINGIVSLSTQHAFHCLVDGADVRFHLGQRRRLDSEYRRCKLWHRLAWFMLQRDGYLGGQ